VDLVVGPVAGNRRVVDDVERPYPCHRLIPVQHPGEPPQERDARQHAVRSPAEYRLQGLSGVLELLEDTLV
jgi:hypothetical protein